MAVELSESKPSPSPASSAKLPPGFVLDKDGKPCRACNTKTSFTQWAKQTQSSLKSGLGTAAGAATGAAAAATAAVASTPAAVQPAQDCPADVETLGRSTWTLLHSIAATYPRSPSHREQSDLKNFMGLFARLYPCWVCAEDFRKYMEKEQIRVDSRNEFGTWLCEAHNAVNTKLGKPVFDCSKWEERWRTGWKDGRCD